MAIKNRERVAWAVSELAVQPTDRILEIGFGPGVALKRIAALAVDGHAVGVELSSLMVAQASRRLAAEIAAGRVELRHGSVSSLALADASFNKTLAINTMMFWPNPVDDLREVARVLEAGGRLAVVHQPHGARDDDAVRRVGRRIRVTMEEAGFVDVSVRTRRMRPVTCLCVSGVNPSR